jgi:hypothetical protein
MVLFNGRRFWTNISEGSGIACRTCPLADKVAVEDHRCRK